MAMFYRILLQSSPYPYGPLGVHRPPIKTLLSFSLLWLVDRQMHGMGGVNE